MPPRVEAAGGGRPAERPGGRISSRRSWSSSLLRAAVWLVSGICARRGVPVVNNSPMTESATVPAAGATKTALDSTDTPDGTTDTGENDLTTAGDRALPAAAFGAWPSPISAADVARGLIRISYPIVIAQDVWWP